MQFKGGSRGFHGALSLPDHLSQGVFQLVFCIGLVLIAKQQQQQQPCASPGQSQGQPATGNH